MHRIDAIMFDGQKAEVANVQDELAAIDVYTHYAVTAFQLCRTPKTRAWIESLGFKVDHNA